MNFFFFAHMRRKLLSKLCCAVFPDLFARTARHTWQKLLTPASTFFILLQNNDLLTAAGFFAAERRSYLGKLRLCVQEVRRVLRHCSLSRGKCKVSQTCFRALKTNPHTYPRLAVGPNIEVGWGSGGRSVVRTSPGLL